MGKLQRTIVATVLAAGSLLVAAPAPASAASCDTELGDMCKFMRAFCASTDGAAKVRDRVINCEGW